MLEMCEHLERILDRLRIPKVYCAQCRERFFPGTRFQRVCYDCENGATVVRRPEAA